MIHKPVITVYGRPGCPFCDKIKDLAGELHQRSLIVLDYHDYKAENLTKEHLEAIAKTEVKTVPVVLWDGVFLPGGYTQFKTEVQEFGWI